MGKLINRIPGLHLMITSLLGSASRMHVEPSASTSILVALPEKTSPSILYVKVQGLKKALIRSCLQVPHSDCRASEKFR